MPSQNKVTMFLSSRPAMPYTVFWLSLLGMVLLQVSTAAPDYGDALTKSILYYEAQRSGKLSATERVQWRGDSALRDGSDSGVDLTGGYYDAGDNVKFGFPMAFTVTLLSWSVVEFGSQLSAKNELSHALEAIKWGTDYFLKASAQPNVLYAQVGDGDSDHACWQRPEDMTTPRTSFKIDESHPGSDLAGETAAALAAASIAFKASETDYATTLLNRAKQLFDFGTKHHGLYSNSIPIVQKFYTSSGYEDELLWASAWIYLATAEQTYLDYLNNSQSTGGSRTMFSWDDKYAGVQTLIAKLVLGGKLVSDGRWGEYKKSAEEFICSCIQKGNSNFKRTPGGLLWWQPWNDLQYTTSASFLVTAYSNYISSGTLQCPGGGVGPTDLVAFARSQVDYILGVNPKSMSYMVGFGQSYPVQVHHRGASVVSIKNDPAPVTCKGGYDLWYNKNAPNPNVLVGALVGGPDENGKYIDSRGNFQQAEPATCNAAPLVGVLARLATG